jgi:phosphonate transport system substrate-binding protein
MKILVASLVLIFWLDLVPSGAGPKLLAAEGRPLIFGRVHDDPVRSIRDRQEFVDFIAKKLAPFGFVGGKILVVEKIHLLAQALKEGKVDLYHDSVVPTLLLGKSAGSIPILRQWKYGEAEYEGVIVVKKNSGINALSDLRGKVIAFEEPHSTSASILPRMLLEENKIKLVQLKSPGPVKPDTVGFVYGADGSAVNVLVTGRVDAATSIPREIERLKPEVRDSLHVIGKTRKVPRQLVAVHKDLDPKAVKLLKEIMIGMDKDSEGQGVLTRQQNTSKFDEIPAASLEQMKVVEKFVFSSLGKEIDSW